MLFTQTSLVKIQSQLVVLASLDVFTGVDQGSAEIAQEVRPFRVARRKRFSDLKPALSQCPSVARIAERFRSSGLFAKNDRHSRVVASEDALGE
jgi:hypothetical protein